MTRRPQCGANTLFSTERADTCDACDYAVWYRDAYDEIEQQQREAAIKYGPRE